MSSIFDQVGRGLGSMFGNLFYDSSGDEANRDAYTQAAIGALKDVQAPNIGQINFATPDRAADVTASPVTAQYASPTAMGDNAFNQVSVDPAYKQQMQAQIGALQELRDKGGLNAQDKANLAGIEANENAAAQGQRGALMQQMAARGMGGSGAELASQISANQNAQNQGNLEGLNVVGQAQNRALQAGQQAAGLAGQMESADYEAEAQKAAAQNAINQFNAQNANQMSLANAQMGNQMGQYNAGQNMYAQLANQNKNQNYDYTKANMQNQGAMYNYGQVPQQNFTNQMEKAKGIAGMNQYGAGMQQQQIANKSQQQGGLWGGLAGLGGAGLNYMGQKAIAGALAGGAGEGAAWGGKVPGIAPIPGNHLENDTFSAKLSPGEVVVPRSMTGQPPAKIGNFVKSAGTMPDRQKEAMLSALKHIRQKGMANGI